MALLMRVCANSPRLFLRFLFFHTN
uniref:Uncharacterized protein n=1 Tax=Anguilla anguilla TaxID=7936 RepID=A0A0E9UFS2_ANGAN